MMDSKSHAPILQSPDGLPSYDSAVASSSTYPHAARSLTASPPLSALQRYLFSGPPNAEDLSTPVSHDIEHIQIKHRLERVTYTSDFETSRITGTDTHDVSLADPLVLRAFLRHTASQIPKVRLKCEGYHTETAEYDGPVSIHGNQENRKKGEPYRVTDFAFFIDMTGIISPYGVSLSVLPSSTPAYRGKAAAAFGASYAPDRRSRHGYAELSSEDRYDSTSSGRRLSWSAHRALTAWNQKRWEMGLPVWAKLSDVPRDGPEMGDVERDGDRYCEDKGWLKQFILRRDVWGWSFEGLVKAAKAAITSTGYNQSLTVEVEWDDAEVVVRPANRWNRANSNILAHVALCITLIYPLIWLPDYLGIIPGGGGKYDIARAAYNLKPYTPLPSTYPGESLEDAHGRLIETVNLPPHIPISSDLKLGPAGVHYLAGKKEGEWFREWEERIKEAARSRFRGEITGRAESTGSDLSLDGYERNWIIQR